MMMMRYNGAAEGALNAHTYMRDVMIQLQHQVYVRKQGLLLIF